MEQRAERVELAAEKRAVLGKQVKRLRRQGWVPGVMYGHGFDPMSLQFEARSLGHVLSRVRGSQLIGVKVAGQDQPEMVLVRDVQRDFIRGDLVHVDFYRVQMTERLRTEVPLAIVGTSPVVEMKEGILLQSLSTIEVECLPGDLVDSIAVDISELVKIDQSLFVRDIAIPAGIEVLTDPSEMVVRVVPVKEEVVEEVSPLPEVAEVEVITAAKAEEEAGEED